MDRSQVYDQRESGITLKIIYINSGLNEIFKMVLYVEKVTFFFF